MVSLLPYPRTTSKSLAATRSPGATSTLATVALRSAVIDVSIFIASMETRGLPRLTFWPGLTETVATAPGIVAAMWSGLPASALGGVLRVASCPLRAIRRGRGRPFSSKSVSYTHLDVYKRQDPGRLPCRRNS